MRKGICSYTYDWNSRSRPARWREVIQSEEDGRWFLMTNGKNYGLKHQCGRTIESITDNPAKRAFPEPQHCCIYCNSPAPDELMAILILHSLGS